MARDFIAASTERIDFTYGGITAFPITLSIWGLTDAIQQMRLIWYGDKDVGNMWFGSIEFNVGGVDHIEFWNWGSGGLRTVDSTTPTAVDDTWFSCTGATTTTTDRDVWLNGGGKGNNTDDSGTPTTPDTITMGISGDSTPSGVLDGALFHGAIWDVVLSDSEVLSIARGIPAFVIRTESIVFFAPLWGNEDPEPDYVNQNNGVLTNTPARRTPNPPVELLENYL